MTLSLCPKYLRRTEDLAKDLILIHGNKIHYTVTRYCGNCINHDHLNLDNVIIMQLRGTVIMVLTMII